MGDQNRAGGFELGRGNTDMDIGDGDSGEFLDAGIRDVEGKERRHIGVQCVPQGLGELGSGSEACAAGGDQYGVTFEFALLVGCECKSGRRILFYELNAGDGFRTADRHACPSSSADQTIDDGLRVVCGWEHAAVGLGFELDSSGGKPVHGVGRAPAVERPDE